MEANINDEEKLYLISICHNYSILKEDFEKIKLIYRMKIGEELKDYFILRGYKSMYPSKIRSIQSKVRYSGNEKETHHIQLKDVFCVNNVIMKEDVTPCDIKRLDDTVYIHGNPKAEPWRNLIDIERNDSWVFIEQYGAHKLKVSVRTWDAMEDCLVNHQPLLNERYNKTRCLLLNRDIYCRSIILKENIGDILNVYVGEDDNSIPETHWEDIGYYCGIIPRHSSYGKDLPMPHLSRYASKKLTENYPALKDFI